MTDEEAKNKLREANRLMRQIYIELNNVANEMTGSAHGIGEDVCARKLHELAGDYSYAINQLRRVI